MQINMNGFLNTNKIADSSVSQLKQGMVTPLQIKERLSDSEALAVIKGQEMKVKFEGDLPENDRVNVEIVDVNENGTLNVKQTSMPQEAASSEESVDDLMAKAGIDPAKSGELKQALAEVTKNGGQVTKETLLELQKFLTSEPGSLDEKLETIRMLQSKKLPITSTQLKAVHQALHGQRLSDSLNKLIDDFDLSIDFSSEKYKPAAKQNLSNQLIKALKEGGYEEAVDQYIHSLKGKGMDTESLAFLKNELLKVGQVFEAGKQIKDKNVQDALKLQEIAMAKLTQALNKTIEAIEPTDSENNDLAKAAQLIVKQIQKEPSFTKILQSMENFIENNDGLNLSGMKESVAKASNLNEQGRELAARRELTEAFLELEKVHPELKQKDTLALSEAEQYQVSQSVQALGLDSKNILVTEITKKLSQLTIDFKKTRQEITRNLSQISNMIEAKQQPAAIKQTLEATITKLDNTILKSDFLLYTDMATEKKLMTASSRLAAARDLLKQGRYPEANAIVKDIKGSVEKVIFQPSDARVKHFVSEQSLLMRNSSPNDLLARQIEQAIKPFPGEEPGVRQVYESIKKLGLMHETDLAQNLLSSKQVQEQTNLKASLLRMMQGDNLQPDAVKTVEQTAASLTGQQLLSKHDSTGQQQLFMQLPFLLEKQVENVKVFVNSQKQGGSIDWENCSLYFVLETKKMGEVGIMLNAQNSNLSLTFKNDQQNFQEKMEPLAVESLNRLADIGYHAGAIQFKPFTAKTVDIVKEQTGQTKQGGQHSLKQKGYDYTI